MIGKEITVGYAVRELRSRITDGPGERLRGAISFAFKLGLFLLKLILAFVLAAFAYSALGIAAAMMALALLLAWLLVPVTSGMIRSIGSRERGIGMGTSYQRTTEQYANADARPRRGTAIAERIGSSGPYFIDYSSEPNPHVLLVGSSSSGKTSTAKAFICRNYLKYGTHFLMIDWNGDNETWAGECGAALWRVPRNLKINMFRLNGMNPEQRASMVEDALLIAGRMTMLQATKVKNMALRHYFAGREPTLDDIIRELGRQGNRNSLIIYRLSAIWRVVGEEPDLFWKSIFGNNTIVSLAGLNESEKAVVAYFLLQRICELFEKEGQAEREKLLVVVDEAWQLLNSSGRLGMHESLAEKVIRVGRRYGFGIIASTQQLGDVPESFINSSSVTFLHNYRQLYGNRLNLNQFDLAYLASAGQGECLVFDRLRSHNGQSYPDYVKVRQLSGQEYAEIKAKSDTFDIPSYAEHLNTLPDLPGHATPAAPPVASTQSRKSPFRIPDGAPSPAEHAAMLAIYYCAEKTKTGLISYIKEKGWIRSDTTMYGYTAKPGVLDGTVNAGFAAKSRNTYSLTEQGLRWVEPERILENQSDKLGSEEHKRLLIRTIHKLHESNMLVTTSRIKHSPDLIAWPVHQKKRYLWDTGWVKGYEIQTSSRKDSVKQNSGKEEFWNVPIIWIYS